MWAARPAKTVNEIAKLKGAVELSLSRVELCLHCISCSKWGRPGDRHLVMELQKDDLAALKEQSRKT